MELLTGNKTRACLLSLAVFCCGCHPSSEGGVNAADAADDWPKDATRFEETDLETVFSDGWVHANTAFDWSGGTAASAKGPASMSFNFTGTRIRWYGWRESGAGIARVLLDGKSAGKVDQYSNTIEVGAPVFTSKELEQGQHTLTIEVTGDANRDSSGTTVFVDAFEVVSLDPVAKPRVRRIEETAGSMSFNGEWNIDSGCKLCSARRDAWAGGPDAMANFNFTGTRVRWLGWRKQAGGLANVYLDGAFVGEFDLYSATTSAQSPLFTSEVLANGPHTLLIEVTGANNPSAAGSLVSVDAFDVAVD
ncbi:MAG TPA: hypothetical protein VFX02_03920 [Gammaproteobacteria bacterium]|nr:hypothetical protein [Gammaproteobacteria bacterium]